METTELHKAIIDTVDKVDKKYKIKRDGQFTISQLVEELGELARVVNYEKLRNKKPMKKDLEDEFADVTIQLVKLADLFQIDIESSVKKKIKIIKERHSIG